MPIVVGKDGFHPGTVDDYRNKRISCIAMTADDGEYRCTACVCGWVFFGKRNIVNGSVDMHFSEHVSEKHAA